MLVFGRRHLLAILREYVAQYNTGRPHRSLALVPPEGSLEARASPVSSKVGRRDVLGGLIHEYHALAA